ncbi:BBT_HP_G0131680.mRNA.1.CDS.1 [Saccharomyces cerevisiae]|nr:BBT_HP_G0131680.mRNA.1.CDS.1 [Saccharomyces cerevisiae]CAI6975359.1 BBT_HP_G0131680.mRNA.1.CDS.1 [Saccharomyces cerevisiae]
MYHEESQNFDPFENTTWKSITCRTVTSKGSLIRIIENPTVQTAVQNGELQVYGLLYNVEDGLLQTVSTYKKLPPK